MNELTMRHLGQAKPITTDDRFSPAPVCDATIERTGCGKEDNTGFADPGTDRESIANLDRQASATNGDFFPGHAPPKTNIMPSPRLCGVHVGRFSESPKFPLGRPARNLIGFA
jgi:hypothetical protein